jgi:hypothetical protein
MSLPDTIAAVLAPHLGDHSADAVARHVCGKYGILDGSELPEGPVLEQLREFLRRGLVVYVGADKAESLAADCLKGV